MPYNPRHIWDGSDMHGVSLEALTKLGEELGYQLVATSMAGVNAFFVRKDLTHSLFPLPAIAENLYNPAQYYRYRVNGHKAKKYNGI